MKREDITATEAEEIAHLMSQRHQVYLQDGEYFEVSGYRSRGEVYTQVILRNEDESFYYPVECQLEVVSSGVNNPMDAQFLLLDFQDYYFGRFLSEGRDVFLTIDWSEYQFDEYLLLARGQIFNRKLDRLADEWLAGGPLASEDGE
ncbi:MAG: hypothetical protein H6728_08310 [Myxococcales bacterium]|nr:hypothetical protein [Myxococcales bacterium]